MGSTKPLDLALIQLHGYTLSVSFSCVALLLFFLPFGHNVGICSGVSAYGKVSVHVQTTMRLVLSPAVLLPNPQERTDVLAQMF